MGASEFWWKFTIFYTVNFHSLAISRWFLLGPEFDCYRISEIIRLQNGMFIIFYTLRLIQGIDLSNNGRFFFVFIFVPKWQFPPVFWRGGGGGRERDGLLDRKEILINSQLEKVEKRKFPDKYEAFSVANLRKKFGEIFATFFGLWISPKRYYFLAIFPKEITTILRPSTPEGGE